MVMDTVRIVRRPWRLHVAADGQVWAGDDCQVGQPIASSVDDFVRHLDGYFAEACDQVDHIRLLGDRRNASLIAHLWRWSATQQPDLPVIVAGNPILTKPLEQTDTRSVLLQLWQPTESQLYHAWWQRLTPSVGCAYALAVAWERAEVPLLSDQPLPALVRRLLEAHPAYPAASFGVRMHLPAIATVFSTLLDPRWFVHPRRPGRLSRLYSFVGLTLENVQAMLGLGDPGRHYERACAVVRAWYNWNAAGDARRGNSKSLGEPESFLWRIYRYHDRTPQAIVVASRYWLRLVHQFWLYHLGGNHPEVRFDAQQFFRYLPEAKQFQKHLLQCRQWLNFNGLIWDT